MSSTNRIGIALLSDEEIPACAEILSKSFGHDAPFVDIYFPDHDTPSGQALVSRRLTAWKQSSPESTFLKAVTKSGQGQELIAGFGIWTLMKEPPPAELEKVENVEEVWPDKDDREFMTRLWSKYVIPRSRVIEESAGKGVYGEYRWRRTEQVFSHSDVVLELLAVHPEYQRLGAGTALVAWGTKAADETGLKVKLSIIFQSFNYISLDYSW